MPLSPASWRPRLNFVRIHYAWIVFCALLAFPVLYPGNNLDPIDVFFFGCSGSTESGLNTYDVKDLRTYQQVFLYVIPIITNAMFIHALVVPVRLYWFRQRLKDAGWDPAMRRGDDAAEQGKFPTKAARKDNDADHSGYDASNPRVSTSCDSDDVALKPPRRTPTITFDDPPPGTHPPPSTSGPVAPSSGPATKLRPDGADAPEDLDAIKPIQRTASGLSRRNAEGAVLATAKSLERVASSAFIIGTPPNRRGGPRTSYSVSSNQENGWPMLSRYATLGRNSNFYNLSEEDCERLGGIEYRALKALLKFVFGYFIGMHLLGVVCLLPWIHNAPLKYTDWLAENGIGRTWWAIYSAQTMTNNLGFTLTPDSMATFKDATWPMVVMTFLALAGNTLYPVLLRLFIWTCHIMLPNTSPAKEALRFLLDHPRRCYTLLFPSRPTWMLFSIVFMLNFIDVILIIALDLHNPAVNDLPMGPRILCALFQAASARHTGTSTLSLSDINPAVQFSLLVMMYIAVYPIAVSIRSSNTYEERAIGLWDSEKVPDEGNARQYVLVHMRNQLSFDLWYIFLGTFLVCLAESERIMDLAEPSFSAFPILFECTSAYGNVGLSLGGPLGNTSMSGHYTVFSKVIICAMMIRGRHRGLPYELDRAITLPDNEPRSDHYHNQESAADTTDGFPTRAVPASAPDAGSEPKPKPNANPEPETTPPDITRTAKSDSGLNVARGPQLLLDLDLDLDLNLDLDFEMNQISAVKWKPDPETPLPPRKQNWRSADRIRQSQPQQINCKAATPPGAKCRK